MSARLRNLNPYELHKYLVNVYCLNKKGSTKALKRDASSDRTDLDVIRENHRFLWEEDDVADTWEKQLAKKYYDKLFKEYCICDLSRYKENKADLNIAACIHPHGCTVTHICLPVPTPHLIPKINDENAFMRQKTVTYCIIFSNILDLKKEVALRWRIEQEVVLGIGQFQCGNKICIKHQELKSWEVNFAYKEGNERRNALVKLRLCPECSDKLNYKSKKREVKRLKRSQKKKRKTSESDECERERSPQTPEAEEPSTSAVNEVQGTGGNDESSWKKGMPETEEKSREEEFEEYLEDLLL